MSRLIDTTKCEVGFTNTYKKTFAGRANRDPKERNDSNRNYRDNFDNIDWNKKK